jgi:hypothetical protein
VSDDIAARLGEFIREAVELRLLAELPPPSASVTDIQGALRDVRQRQDRVEELLRRAMRAKVHAQRAAAAAQATADEAWDQTITRQRVAPVVRGDEYMTAKERHAHANLEVLEPRRAARAADELAHLCEATVDQLRTCYWGLSGLREDIRELLRTTAFESHLER